MSASRPCVPKLRRSVRHRCREPTLATTALIGRGRNVGPTPPASKNGLRAVRADVIDLLAIAVEQRLRDIVEELIAISKVRGAGRGQGGGRARGGRGEGRGRVGGGRREWTTQ